ncbi:MAG: HPr family phosphocarrier protein [Victivallaceae bacterium]|nr:HPr family phosphocarrier protein [Victivallaceae bacterium]
MVERKIVVRNRAGIHCRPSGMIIKALSGFPGCTLQVLVGDLSVNVAGMLDLVSLAMACGTEATIRLEGPGEENAVKMIGDLFEYEFDFK